MNIITARHPLNGKSKLQDPQTPGSLAGLHAGGCTHSKAH